MSHEPSEQSEVHREPIRRLLPDPYDPGAFPAPPRHGFRGREAELDRLQAELTRHRVVHVRAPHGTGKSALTREAAERWGGKDRFPDGACHVSFAGGGGAELAVATLGAYMEGPAFTQLASAEQARRARRYFDERGVLVVWSHVDKLLERPEEDAVRRAAMALLRDWTADPEGRGRLVLTSAPAEGESAAAEAGLADDLPAVGRMTLEGLVPEDALTLLEALLEAQADGAPAEERSRRDLETLVEIVGGHPLALELVVSLLTASSPKALAAELTASGAGAAGGLLPMLLERVTSRLSEAAREALAGLEVFEGGVFEALAVEILGLPTEDWDAVRRELQDAGLVRIDTKSLQHESRPYLRLHPALRSRSAPGRQEEAADGELRQRFVAAYKSLATEIWTVVFQSKGRHRALEMLALEEVNFRTALRWAVEDGAFSEAVELGNTFGEYLRRTGRNDEREKWLATHAAAMGEAGYDEERARYEHVLAWDLFNHARASEAVVRLEFLLERLRAVRAFDPVELTAIARLDLGRIFQSRGHANRAVVAFEAAAADWEVLAERRRARGESAEAERRKLAAVFGFLAGAYTQVGRVEETFESLGKASRLAAELGEHGQSAIATAQMARILSEQERFEEADEHFVQALEAARRGGDRSLEATLLQYRGSLAEQVERDTLAAECYQRALEIFHELGDGEGLVETCNLLGVLGQKTGHLPEARAWYEKARELAGELEGREPLRAAAQNLGATWRQEGEAELERGEAAAARRCFEAAAASLEECLEMQKDTGDRRALAATHGQLAQVLALLGQPERASEAAHKAREIREQYGVKEVWQEYHTLAGIARATGDEAAAGEWEGKRDALLAELGLRAS